MQLISCKACTLLEQCSYDNAVAMSREATQLSATDMQKQSSIDLLFMQPTCQNEVI